ncbi:MAG: RepB family plasmid replication initiator protein [Lautropia sp.]
MDIEDIQPRALPPPELRAQREDQTLAKANEAIAIRPKRGKLTLLSRRIYNALLYHSQRQGVDLAHYALPLTELIGDARFNSNNTELLKSHLRDMQATTIEWSTSSAGQKKWLSTQLIGTVSIEEPGRGRPCVIRWTYPDEIRERLVRPNQYTKVLLEMSARMRSYPAAVLYEIGARYQTSPAKLSMREDTIWWAAVLTGRSDRTTIDYRFFKRDVINRALTEVDALCDEFSLELIEYKRGRKVEELQFRVLPKAQRVFDAIDDPTKNVFDLALVERMMKLGMKQDDAQDLYAVTDEAQLRTALEHVEQRARSETLPRLQSSAAYLRDAIRKGYVNGIDAKAGQGAAKRPKRAVQTSAAERMQQIRDAWDSDRFARARALYEEMDTAQQAELRTRFDASAMGELPKPIATAWTREGTKSRIAASSFFRWMASSLWPEAPTEKALLDFAVARNFVQVDRADGRT